MLFAIVVTGTSNALYFRWVIILLSAIWIVGIRLYREPSEVEMLIANIGRSDKRQRKKNSNHITQIYNIIRIFSKRTYEYIGSVSTYNTFCTLAEISLGKKKLFEQKKNCFLVKHLFYVRYLPIIHNIYEWVWTTNPCQSVYMANNRWNNVKAHIIYCNNV